MTDESTYTLEECIRIAEAEFDPAVDYLAVLKAMILHISDVDAES